MENSEALVLFSELSRATVESRLKVLVQLLLTKYGPTHRKTKPKTHLENEMSHAHHLRCSKMCPDLGVFWQGRIPDAARIPQSRAQLDSHRIRIDTLVIKITTSVRDHSIKIFPVYKI